MQMKIKAKIEIVLDEMGALHLKASSGNKITNLGMLELGKAIINNQNIEPASNLVIPQIN